MFKRSGLNMQHIIIEITERTVVEDYDRLLDALAPLRRAGIRIAVDNVGAGFASMRHVLILRPELIKIDRSIISGIDSDTWQHVFGAAMVAFAGETGSAVIAEGIETPEELAAVTALGMFAGQGYLLGSPCTDTDEWATWTSEGDDGAPSEPPVLGQACPRIIPECQRRLDEKMPV
jgi:EAL domain-containing protein (putative c-di-GMP-specific phosphodiesterase class I)